MSHTEHVVNSISELLVALASIATSQSGSVWYRGHSNADWKLVPGYGRLTGHVSETTLMNRFKQSAAMLLERSPTASFDWLFLMQHYGVPTRLLDWSESPIVALYFAISDVKHDGTDAALWVLKPSALNRHANIVDKNEPDYIPSFDDEEMQSYSTESVRTNTRIALLPVATIATRNNPRIQAQMGVFTIHHNDMTAIEDVGDGAHVDKIVIPAASKTHMVEEIKLLGISKFQMFPELVSVGEMLRGSAL